VRALREDYRLKEPNLNSGAVDLADRGIDEFVRFVVIVAPESLNARISFAVSPFNNDVEVPGMGILHQFPQFVVRKFRSMFDVHDSSDDRIISAISADEAEIAVESSERLAWVK
jgi:hypothetical protein